MLSDRTTRWWCLLSGPGALPHLRNLNLTILMGVSESISATRS